MKTTLIEVMSVFAGEVTLQLADRRTWGGEVARYISDLRAIGLRGKIRPGLRFKVQAKKVGPLIGEHVRLAREGWVMDQVGAGLNVCRRYSSHLVGKRLVWDDFVALRIKNIPKKRG